MSIRLSALARPRERAPYEPFGACRVAWRSARREVLLAGPSNTGKSRGWLEKLHYCMDKYPKARGLIVRKTRKSLTQSAMVTFEQKVLPQGWLGKRGLIRFNASDQQYEYPNGSIIGVSGLDDPQKVMSSEWDFIYFQEATEGTRKDWESLSIRLRNHVMPYQQLGGDCNPSYPTHWLKLRCDTQKTLMVFSRHEDNPSITPEDMAALDNLTGVMYLRYRKGIWAAAEGMVYDEWDEARHKVTREQLKQWGAFYGDGTLNRQVIKHVIGGCDWGYTNPGVLHVYGIDSDKRMYLLREVYRTHKTIDWWIEQANALNTEFGSHGNPGIERWKADPSRPDYIAQFNGAGLPCEPANNDIALGIGFLRQRLRKARDGRPRFLVYEYANTERDEELYRFHKPTGLATVPGEIEMYTWAEPKDGRPLKEEPIDDFNHALDVARYVSAELDAGSDLGELDEDTAQAIWRYRGY